MGMREQERIEEVLARLVCPVCHGPLELGQDRVRCAGCGRSYPIDDGIPVLLELRAIETQRD